MKCATDNSASPLWCTPVRGLPGPSIVLRFAALLVLALIFCLPSLSFSQSIADELTPYSVPANMSQVEFYLLTVDVGDQVWDNFGHTALRVIDENTNTDLVFNWGIFDISGGVVGFSFNFFKGIMEYQLATSAPTREFAMYLSLIHI